MHQRRALLKDRMRTIEAARLTLEPQTASHAVEMFDVLSDPAIYAYENSPPRSLEWLRTRFEKLESRQSPDGTQLWLNWVVRLKSGELIGYVQATVHQDGKAAIAYEFSSAYWGRGLAHEAADALIRELVQHYDVSCLTAVAKSANMRSLRLLERLGFSALQSEGGETLFVRKMPL
jgi:RimJ/RimL family protein N-acetyltransferase